MDIRLETIEDIAAIRHVNDLAFGRPAEGELVDRLRAAGAIIASLVAEVDGRLIGHALFSPAALQSGSETIPIAALGPVAVLPENQRQGAGLRLITSGLEMCRAAGYDLAIVLGHPAYYPRFGFRPAAPLGVRWEHNAPEEAFMVMALRPGALAGVSGIARYRPEFDGV